ncbi:MAG TPA: porin [Steroidobacteraceae bacterium]
MSKQASSTLGGCSTRGSARAGALLALTFAAAGIAQAQTAAPAPAKTEDSSLTWKGITLYGIVDIGVTYQTHGAPASDYFPNGTYSVIQKFHNGSTTAVTPSNLAQSRIGLSGNEPIAGDWAGVFRLETFFNPQSGNLSDALKSLALNNGKALSAYTTGADSSVAGQYFAGAAYAGFSSPTFGTITFGRHVTPLADGIAKYDPMGASQSFSLIGESGTTAGAGDTENRRLDQSLKYTFKYNWLHAGALYQFSGASGSTNTAVQVTLGAEYAGLSFDAYYGKKYNAVAASTLSAGQVASLQSNCTASITPPAAPSAQCYSVSNSLAGTISDNTDWSVMGLYNFGVVKLYAGYEHVSFANPKNPSEPGQPIMGGYVLAIVNNTAFPNDKILQIFWAGAKWTVTPELDLTVAYYGYKQNAYGTGADAGCSSVAHGVCSGTENVGSFVADYRLSKRFDVYIGTIWSEVKDGLANGFLLTSDNTTSTAATITTTAGLRFKF